MRLSRACCTFGSLGLECTEIGMPECLESGLIQAMINALPHSLLRGFWPSSSQIALQNTSIRGSWITCDDLARERARRVHYTLGQEPMLKRVEELTSEVFRCSNLRPAKEWAATIYQLCHVGRSWLTTKDVYEVKYVRQRRRPCVCKAQVETTVPSAGVFPVTI